VSDSENSVTVEPSESAWQIYAAISDAIGKVDAKASYFLALDSGLVVALIALSDGGQIFESVDPIRRGLFYWPGFALLLVAAALAAWAIAPRLNVAKAAQTPSNHSGSDFTYFGRLRSLAPRELERILSEEDPTASLSRSIVAMSTIAWRKHRIVWWSLLTTGIGVLAEVTLAALEIVLP
jgi:hypothetical protein